MAKNKIEVQENPNSKKEIPKSTEVPPSSAASRSNFHLLGMYSRVTTYCDWIEEETGKEAKCVEAKLDDDIYW